MAKKHTLPRYYQIYNGLLQQIRSGELAVGEALPPERKIAEDFGVARLTVVKALDLLARDGLIDKQQGRGTFVLPSRDNKTIAYIKAGWPVYHELGGISQVVFEKHYRLQMLAVDSLFDKLESYIEACLDNGVQGFLFYARSGYDDLHIYQHLIDRGIPMVMLDRYYPKLNVDRVTYDDELAAFELTSKLIYRGHHRIAIIPGLEVETTTVKHRLKGYIRAFKHHGLQVQDDLIWFDLYKWLSVGNSLDQDRQQCLEKLTRTRPTAVVTINDGIYEKFSHDLSYFESVNGDGEFALEAATFSYRMLPESSILKLIALQPGETLGRTAAEFLLGRLEGRRKRKHAMIPMHIQELGRKALGKEVGKTPINNK